MCEAASNIREEGREKGIGVIVAVMALLLITALGAAIVLTTSADVLIAANFQTAAEGFYAADAAFERAADDLAAVGEWSVLLDGTQQSGFVDGPPSGERTLADGTTVNLEAVLNLANCGSTEPCSAADLVAVTPERPWGVNNPEWRLFAYGPMASLVPGATIESDFYVVVMVGDDPDETDGDPRTDGGPPAPPAAANPGAGVALLRAEAYGPGGTRAAVEATVARSVRTVAWRELP